MPPCPISRRMRYAPTRLPAIACDWAETRSAAGQSSRKLAAPSKLDSSDSTSLRRESSPAQASRKKRLRSPASRSRAKANSSFTWSHFSGIFFLVASLELTRPPRFGQVPITLHGGARNSRDSRRFLDAQTTQKAQLHKMGLRRIEFRQSGEGIVQFNDMGCLSLGQHFDFFEKNFLKAMAALLGAMAAPVVNQNPAHQLY